MAKIGFPFLQYLLIIFITAVIWSGNSKCATHWRFEHGEVNAVSGEDEIILEKDPFFRILANPWPKPGHQNSKDNGKVDFVSVEEISEGAKRRENTMKLESENALQTMPLPAWKEFSDSALTCGDPVNETSIDHLEGIAERFLHPVYPEPEVALLFRKNEFDNVQTDVIEVNLLDGLKSGENKLVLFNQIGNFLRIRGDTYHSIECFRSAMVVTHSCPDIYLNLARIMLNLNFVKDAIFLAERSLEQQNPEQSSWLQHFTLGEILSQTGDIDRAVTHFQMALDENPAFHPAQLNLRKLQDTPLPTSSNVHTIIIITILCSLFLFYLYFTIIKEPTDENNNKGGGSFFTTLFG